MRFLEEEKTVVNLIFRILKYNNKGKSYILVLKCYFATEVTT